MKKSKFQTITLTILYQMKILIIGSGGREYAIAQKLRDEDKNHSLCYIGNSENAGLNDIVVNKYIGNILDKNMILQKANEWNIEFTVIGPETPLQIGLVDFLEENGKKCFGPKKLSAQIETSKTFARKFMGDLKMNEFTPDFIFLSEKENRDLNDLLTFITTHEGNFVIKPDGPCGGKGVKVSGDHFNTIEEGIEYVNEIDVAIVVEEKLIGEEFSFMTFTDGKTCKHTLPIKDYKRAFENDQGPNTGSMGCVSGANGKLWFLDDHDIRVAKNINERIISEMHLQNNEYFQGILYGSFIKTDKGIKVIEFNARFGDPECVNLLALMKSDLLELMLNCSNQTLHEFEENIVFSNDACVFKYLVPNGYPDAPIKGHVININNMDGDIDLIFANISKNENNEYIELGSRTIGVLRLANSIQSAAELVNNDVR